MQEQIQKIIEKAIEGGWNKQMPAECSWCQYDHTVLDPLFWQSLGKACGWGKNCPICDSKANGLCSAHQYSTWQGNALKFYEINLTEGWGKAVEYIYQLTNNKDEEKV